jgi:hypothetical protein
MGRVKYHVTPTGKGDWKVKREGTSRADSVHSNKSDAVDRAKELAKSNPLGQVIIHGQDNKIQTEHTYEKDPYPPKG